MTKAPKDGLWFVSVGGNPTEVVRVSDGKMYSIGCADPHDLGGIEFIEMVDDMPLNAKRKASRERAFSAAKERQFKRTGVFPGYRTFPHADIAAREASRSDGQGKSEGAGDVG